MILSVWRVFADSEAVRRWSYDWFTEAEDDTAVYSKDDGMMRIIHLHEHEQCIHKGLGTIPKSASSDGNSLDWTSVYENIIKWIETITMLH